MQRLAESAETVMTGNSSRGVTRLRFPVAVIAGACSVLAFAPFGFWPLALAGLAVMFGLWRTATPREAFVLGWGYGIGLFGVGFFWVRISISVYGGAPLALALASALLLAAAMALYPALAGAMSAHLAGRNWRRTAFAAPAAWTFFEWLRAWLFTGFPWLQTGYSQIDSPLAGLAPLGGVLSVTLGVALVAGWVATLADRRAPRLPLLSLVLLAVGSGIARNHEWTQPAGDPVRVALLQGNVAQEEKWLADKLVPTIDRYLEMTGAQPDSDMIIWPEAAIPALAHEIEEMLLEPLQAFAARERKVVVTGLLFVDEPGTRYFTSVLALDGGRDRYDKRHLVPFGEYFPLGFLWKDALRGLATVSEDFTAGDAKKPLINAGPWPVGASICYEVLFGEEIREALPEARFLVNVSNDGWFGDSIGPHQHFEVARMRALETGRFLLRATNTGVTAIIDPLGRVVDRLPQFRQDTLVGDVEPRAGMTPYARWGEWPALLLAFLMALWCRYGRARDPASPGG